ncbi:esterase [Vibrio harveyi]|nr:esterase [Vibrio harveyi]
MEVLKRWFIALSIGVVLSACGGGDGSSVDSSSAYVPAEKIQDNIFSNITGVNYPYDIYLFLTQELIPIVEAEYDIDPNERTLAGHSFGGAKTAYIMLTEDIGVEFFKNFIISDGSFWRIDDTIYSLEEQRYEASPWLEATAILSSTNIGNHPSVDAFYKHIQSKGYMGFNLPPLIEYKKLDHGKMWYHTYRDSLPILFPKEEI